MQKIVPCLWFDNNAEEAIEYYISIFNDSRIESVSRYGAEGPGPEGSVLVIEFTLEGQRFMALNGGPDFAFTPAISLYVNVATQEELDRIWNQLSAYPEEEQCGWLKDRFGLSWQIVPTMLGEMMNSRDAIRKGRMVKALMKMKKLDMNALIQAFEQPQP